MTGLAAHDHVRLGALGHSGEVLLVDVLHYAHHYARRAFGAFVVRGELDRIERRPLAPDVTVGAPHAEAQGEAPHGGEQLLFVDHLGQHLQVRERIRWKLSLRSERGCERSTQYGESDHAAHRSPQGASRADIGSPRAFATVRPSLPLATPVVLGHERAILGIARAVDRVLDVGLLRPHRAARWPGKDVAPRPDGVRPLADHDAILGTAAGP